MEGRPLYRTVAAVGLAAHALGTLIYTVFTPGDDKMFFGALCVVAVVAAIATWSWTKGIWVSLVAGLALEVTTFWFVFPMAQGFAVSALDAVPALIGFVGAWTAIIASIRGVTKRREEHAFSGSTKRKLLTGVGIIVVLAVASTALTMTGKETVSDADAAGTTLVAMQNGDEFAPTEIEVSATEPTKFLVRNDDPFAHTFTIDEAGYDINEAIGPGSEKVITFTPKGEGDVEFVCEFHSDMKGTLAVG